MEHVAAGLAKVHPEAVFFMGMVRAASRSVSWNFLVGVLLST